MSETQLALDVTVEETVTQSPSDIDLAESILTAHGGDALEAIRNLLADADFLRGELYTASCLLSHGMSRGWRPRYERV